MAQIFLSYSRKDHRPMIAVKTALSRARLTVWTDEELEPGTPVWQRRVESEIKAASWMVVLLSPAAKDSLWVRSEISRARLVGINIVPVIVDGEDPDDFLPLGLENTNWIDIRRHHERGGLARLVETLTPAVVPVIVEEKDPDDFLPGQYRQQVEQLAEADSPLPSFPSLAARARLASGEDGMMPAEEQLRLMRTWKDLQDTQRSVFDLQQHAVSNMQKSGDAPFKWDEFVNQAGEPDPQERDEPDR